MKLKILAQRDPQGMLGSKGVRCRIVQRDSGKLMAIYLRDLFVEIIASSWSLGEEWSLGARNANEFLNVVNMK